jgi:peptidoglycan/LPS O-acetylase OafA/YrhL
MRYLRLIPAYLAVLLFFWKLLPFVATGPQWYKVKSDYSDVCDTWWRNALMLDNLISIDGIDYCMGVSWYISNDF